MQLVKFRLPLIKNIGLRPYFCVCESVSPFYYVYRGALPQAPQAFL